MLELKGQFVSPRKAGAPSVKEWIKVAGVVALLAVAGADLGWRIATISGSPADQAGKSQPHQESSGDSDHPNGALPMAAPAADIGPAERRVGSNAPYSQNPSQDHDGTNIWMILQGLSAPFAALFALALLCVAHLQLRTYRRQAGIMRHQARISAQQTALIDKQATVAHQTYIATHRAILRARRFRITLMQAGRPIKVEFETINTGATDADVTGRVVLVPILDAPGAVFGLPTLPLEFVIQTDKLKGGETMTHVHVDDSPVCDDAVAAVNAGTRFLHVIGRIAYTDDNGHPRETGFFRCYDVELRRFRNVDDPDYEYED